MTATDRKFVESIARVFAALLFSSAVAPIVYGTLGYFFGIVTQQGILQISFSAVWFFGSLATLIIMMSLGIPAFLFAERIGRGNRLMATTFGFVVGVLIGASVAYFSELEFQTSNAVLFGLTGAISGLLFISIAKADYINPRKKSDGD